VVGTGESTMANYKYLIIGGGMAGDAAAKAIHEIDPDGSIGMISRDGNPPYDRPPLSKGLWKDMDYDEIWRDTEELGVDLHLSTSATEIDPAQKVVRDENGEEYAYEKLLLATGGKPRRLKLDAEDIIYFRTADDYLKLKEFADQHERFGIIGGGFIGSEIAAALSMHGKKVTMFFLEKGLCAAILPESLSLHLNEFYTAKGVELHPEEAVTGVERSDEGITITTNAGTELTFDVVVAGLGIIPDTGLAEAAGIDVDNGILVNDHLETSQAGIFSAGDVARFTNPALDVPMRFEHEDNANESGEAAGRNMAGEESTYDHLPFFYSDLFDIGYEAIGDTNPAQEIVMDWLEENEQGVIYYTTDHVVRGVLLWNVLGRVDEARSIINTGKAYEPGELIDLISKTSEPIDDTSEDDDEPPGETENDDWRIDHF